MENAAEALKIAFAVMMFVLALTLSISSFSQASSAIDAIKKIDDRTNEYTYVEPHDGLYRTVGIDAVVSTMYRALDENIQIFFKESVDGEPIPLFYATRIDVDGYYLKDEIGQKKMIDSIDFSNEAPRYEKLYLDAILGGTLDNISINEALEETFGNADDTKEIREAYKEMYKKKLEGHYPEGLYNAFKEKQFIELFGEYYQGEGASEIRKGVITYIIKE